MTELVAFYPRASLCRVDDTLYNTRHFAWGVHTWDYLAGLAGDREETTTLQRYTSQGCRSFSFCLDVHLNILSIHRCTLRF